MAVVLMHSGQALHVEGTRDAIREQVDAALASHTHSHSPNRFGFGSSDRDDRPLWIEVPSLAGRWPDGSVQKLTIDARRVEGVLD